MGYETKLIIGRTSSHPLRKLVREKAPIINGDCLYYPPVKGDDGEEVYSDTYQVYFQVYATIDMCKMGDSELSKILKVNTNDKLEYYWSGTDGNARITEDCYGDKPELATIEDCVKALEKDVLSSEYRRFCWALALLKSMEEFNKSGDIKVLWYGY